MLMNIKQIIGTGFYLIFILYTSMGYADQFECNPDVPVLVKNLGRLQNLKVLINFCKGYDFIGDQPQFRMIINMLNNQDKLIKNQTLYNGDIGDIIFDEIKIIGNKIMIPYKSGNRFMPEDQTTTDTWEWDVAKNRLKKIISQTTSSEIVFYDKLQKTLNKNEFDAARAMITNISSLDGVTFNEGHSFENDKIFTMFLKAINREAWKKYKTNKSDEAGALIFSILYNPPFNFSQNNDSTDDVHDDFYVCLNGTEKCSGNHAFYTIHSDEYTALLLNKTAYILEKSGYASKANVLIQQIATKYPNLKRIKKNH